MTGGQLAAGIRHGLCLCWLFWLTNPDRPPPVSDRCGGTAQRHGRTLTTRVERRRDGGPSRHIVIANHFSGSKTWSLLERLVCPLAACVGFRSDFNLAEKVLAHDWTVESVRTSNLVGLSCLAVLRNG